MYPNSKSGSRSSANLGVPMARQFLGDADALRLAELQTRIMEAATWLGRDVTELNHLLDRLRARRRIVLVGQADQMGGLATGLAQAHEALLVATPEAAYEISSLNTVDAVITAQELPGAHDGLWLLAQLRASHPSVLRVLIAREELRDWAQHERDGLLHRFLVTPVHVVDVTDLLGDGKGA